MRSSSCRAARRSASLVGCSRSSSTIASAPALGVGHEDQADASTETDRILWSTVLVSNSTRAMRVSPGGANGVLNRFSVTRHQAKGVTHVDGRDRVGVD